MNPILVSPDWLFANLEDVKVVDASWYLPTTNRNPKAEFDAQHIPGAVFFDHDDVVDPKSDLPHTIPDATTFAAKVGALGISETDTIVVYDGAGLFSAPRAWWLFRTFGATKVMVLDGGLPGWLEARLPVESGSAPIYPVLFKAERNDGSWVGLDAMRSAVGQCAVLDARPAGRFTGQDAEPRAGMRTGHMPGATSVPASSLIENGRLLPAEKLRAAIVAAGVDLSKPTITTCGSGVTAAIISLALETLGHTNHRLYDGSWSEWGGRDDTPVETGG
ncbi:MAG: 3-mercaptopyruvate sulfurtransferase [Pseudomonadota bacterium]